MNLQYPIGKYVPQDYSEKLKNEWLSDIMLLPNQIETAVANLDAQQLQTPYRDGGWTVHQLVHHVADSHMNGYIRLKNGYAEMSPTIMIYDEKIWANLNDVKKLSIDISVTLLYSLHRRWQEFMICFTEQDFQKTVFHPEYNKKMTLWYLLGLYAWHGKHHVAHITQLKKRMMW
jgi:uncharacterized damage-inducible protein DinB